MKAKLDGEYVEKMSVIFDLKCFFITIIKVMNKDGFIDGESEKTEQKAEQKAEKKTIISTKEPAA